MGILYSIQNGGHNLLYGLISIDVCRTLVMVVSRLASGGPGGYGISPSRKGGPGGPPPEKRWKNYYLKPCFNAIRDTLKHAQK